MKLDTDGLDGLLCPPRGRMSRLNPRGGVGIDDEKIGPRQGGVAGREPVLERRASKPSASPGKPSISVASDPILRSKSSASTAPKTSVTPGMIVPKRPSPMPPSMLSRGKTLAFMPAITPGKPPEVAPRMKVAKTITTPAPRILPKRTENVQSANMKAQSDRDVGSAFSKTVELPPVDEVSVAIVIEPDTEPETETKTEPETAPETLGVSSNLGMTQRGRPMVVPTIPPLSVPNRDSLLDTVESVSPNDVTDTPQSEGKTRKRFNPVPLAAGVLIVFAAAFFGKEYLSRMEEKGSSSRPIVAADSAEQVGKDAVLTESSTPSMTFETPKDVGPDETARVSGAAAPGDETARASVVPSPDQQAASDAIRFPGRYQKGDVHPDISRWGEVDHVFQSIRGCKNEIFITGYTCDLGDDETNRLVSEKRAQIVSHYFIERGYDRKRLVVQGMGASRPIMDNETEEGRMLNRRVEILCR